MANPRHLDILREGAEVWNQWRRTDTLTNADLSGANLSQQNLWKVDFLSTDLTEADLSHADLSDSLLRMAKLNRANLTGAKLYGADLKGADLSGANLELAELENADLSYAKLIKAHLKDTRLCWARIRNADFNGAKLENTNLAFSLFENTDFKNAELLGCYVYGLAAWKSNFDNTKQLNLTITPPDEPIVTVDNLEVAQFIYTLLVNQKIRDVLHTITSKAVLILGRFTPERKVVLDALREELRRHDYLPILFDFEKSPHRNLTETVSTLAHLARFAIADITDAKSIPQELQRIVPNLPSLPVQPLLLSSQNEYSMFRDFDDYPWVLKLRRYDSLDGLLASVEEVIGPAESKAKEIEARRGALEKEFSGNKP